ncbi:MAG: phytanoyl-CoA dioxygenase family protein [Myxococcales bacterium]|nr:phytanoyl-CoA dioxygenase family protein [Myxococcales bacterium]
MDDDDDFGAFFAAHGWAVVQGVVSAEGIAELTAAFDEVLPPSLYAVPAPNSPVLEVIAASRAHAAIARHVHYPEIARFVARALGCRRVQLLQDTVLLKPPHNGGRVEWHQDHTYTGFLEPAATVSVRLALTDDTVDSGCMNVLDGSHRWGHIGETRILNAGSVTDTLGLLTAPWAERARAATRSLELRAGDISLHHCLTFHGSLENHSQQPRKTLIARLFDGACTLIPSRLPAALAGHFPTNGDGHLAQSAFPIVFQRD